MTVKPSCVDGVYKYSRSAVRAWAGLNYMQGSGAGWTRSASKEARRVQWQGMHMRAHGENEDVSDVDMSDNRLEVTELVPPRDGLDKHRSLQGECVRGSEQTFQAPWTSQWCRTRSTTDRSRDERGVRIGIPISEVGWFYVRASVCGGVGGHVVWLWWSDFSRGSKFAGVSLGVALSYIEAVDGRQQDCWYGPARPHSIFSRTSIHAPRRLLRDACGPSCVRNMGHRSDLVGTCVG